MRTATRCPRSIVLGRTERVELARPAPAPVPAYISHSRAMIITRLEEESAEAKARLGRILRKVPSPDDPAVVRARRTVEALDELLARIDVVLVDAVEKYPTMFDFSADPPLPTPSRAGGRRGEAVDPSKRGGITIGSDDGKRQTAASSAQTDLDASMGSRRMGEADVREGICLEVSACRGTRQLPLRSDQGSNRGPIAVADECATVGAEGPTIRCRITTIGTARPRTKQAKMRLNRLVRKINSPVTPRRIKRTTPRLNRGNRKTNRSRRDRTSLRVNRARGGKNKMVVQTGARLVTTRAPAPEAMSQAKPRSGVRGSVRTFLRAQPLGNHMVRSTASAIRRHCCMSWPNAAGVIVWAPSLTACSGSS